MNLERLEERQLLAGAQLIGIQPNDGALLQEGDIRNVAPNDLTFRFDQSQVIDPASLGNTTVPGGIQITRANLDGTFAPASVRDEFGSAGAVELEFSAVRLGQEQNGITLRITKSDFGGPGLPGVSVQGRTININLNINAGNQTTALDLVNALGNSAAASNLIDARILRGDGSFKIGVTATGNSSIVLGDPANPRAHVANDIVVLPGFIGVGEQPATNEVIYRFAGRVPDDRYRIDVFGSGATPLKNVNNEPYLDGRDTQLTFELDLAPQVISVVPQPVIRLANNTLRQDRDKILVYFNNDDLNRTAAEDPRFYQLIHTADTLENTDDRIFHPVDVDYSPEKDLAILTFAGDLASLAGPGSLRLRIGTDEIKAGPTPTPAPPVFVAPEAAAEADYSGVRIRYVGTGETWGQAIRVEAIASDHGGDTLPRVTVRDNVITVELNTNSNPGNLNSPSNAQHLVDAVNAHFNAGSLVRATVVSGSPATVIAGGALPEVTLLGLGSSFSTSSDLGLLAAQNVIVRSEIDPQVYRLQLPGSNLDPGHRQIADQHLPDDSANRNVSDVGDGLVDMGITRFEYNFRQDIGFLSDAQGNRQTAFNVITETQKRRAREIFQLLNDLTGVEFVETERDGLIIASGDSLAFNPNQPLRVMPVNLDERFNGPWFRSALSAVGDFLGLGLTSDLPPQAIRGDDADLVFDNRVEPAILSDHDLVHLRQLYYPESKDIDMYRFRLDTAGKFTAETFAERQLKASLLDTSLTLYRENADGSRQLIARNDDYFGRDSFLAMDLQPGVYYVGVSASGNADYDPTIEDTGFGGTSEGEYDLRFNFRPDSFSAIFDADNPNLPPTNLDGNGDGTPGGIYNFWFRTQTPANTLFLDKAAPSGGTGAIAAPFNTVTGALGAAKPGQVVRIVGNGGADRNLTTLGDNLAYQIGFNSLGQALPDGSTMEVPQGVTVMVDAGAIFQLRRARIGVGSSAAGIDRSAGALQILGAPALLADTNGNGSLEITDSLLTTAAGATAPGSAYFTSYNDQSIGLDTNPFVTTPASGDWGGIVLRNDIDRSQGNFVWDEEGIFLDYVNHADIRYGGGNVLINSVATVVNPIDITGMRPTVTFNTISRSADAAMSASPDSFEETNFHAPRHQRIAFTSDYDRVGPNIHGNRLVNNSINGLFVRVTTQAGSSALKLNVSGRWDDTDIVHVMSENLAIAAQPGGRNELLTAPPINLVTQTPANDGSATGGGLGVAGQSTRYSYKLTYVDRFGYESPASVAMPTVTLTATQVANRLRSIRFNQLPPAPSGYVARRLYRSENGGPYTLVTQLNRLATTSTDSGVTRGGILHVPPVVNTTLTAQIGGTLLPGTYRYQFVYVDANGKESRASDTTSSLAISGNPDVSGAPGSGSILLAGLPVPAASGNFVARRIYRSQPSGAGPYVLAAEIDTASTTFTDAGFTDPTRVLDAGLPIPRLGARLAINPSLVVKLDGARFEIEMGAQLLAEGDDGREVILTSIADDRYGAGGTFDSGNDGPIQSGSANAPNAGDWGGIYAGPLSDLSLDHALFAYGGGVTRVEGTFTAFNVVEVHEQSEARIANSVFEFNARGQGGQGETDRFGRGFNEPAVIFVRQAQPIIFNNIFRNNPNAQRGDGPADPNAAIPAISINVNALNHELKRDTGRRTGAIDRVEGYRDNQGPLVLDNRLDNNEINGMVVRGQTLTTQSVWDDADIVHVLLDTVYVPDFHTFGGLVLASSPTESLVVKLWSDTNSARTAGFVATGTPREIGDRIGGVIQIIGQPGSPVVLTSLRDDTRGAGQRPDGDPQTDTNSDGAATLAAPGDWASVRLSEFAHDRNVELFYEFEARDVNSPGPNGSPDEAQLLGVLAPSEYAGDENRRLGFTVKGFLTDARDMDVYSFKAIPGTEVWVDVDRTTQSLDALVELLDGDGNIVARSDNSPAELANPDNYLQPSDRVVPPLTARQLADPTLLMGEARLLDKTPQLPTPDLYTINPRDPGMRVILPGIPDPTNPDRPLTYHVRIRSSSPTLDLADGLTSGAYQLQLRLREMDEIGGSTVRYATISYATNGIEIYGQPIHSPLTGEAAEPIWTPTNGVIVNNETITTAQPVGNLLGADRGTITIAGILENFEDGNGNTPDVDFYRIDLDYLDYNNVERYPFGTFETIFDLDYANGLDDRPNVAFHVYRVDDMTTPDNPADDEIRLIYNSRDGNVADDRPSQPGTSDVEDLSRGTVGATDPFLGVVDLSAGALLSDGIHDYDYLVAVTADRTMPSQLDQFLQLNATNPNLRMEPIASVRRIAEDHIDFGNNSTADPPQISELFSNGAAVPWHLGDVTLFLSRDRGIPGDPTSTTILTVDPFTGTRETTVGEFGHETDDVTMHPNGQLYAYRLSTNEPVICRPRDEWEGNFLEINPGDGTAQILSDDGIETYIAEPDFLGSELANLCGNPPVRYGDGIEYAAITFYNNLDGFAVGERGFAEQPQFLPGVEIFENILYHFIGNQNDANFGLATSSPQPDRDDTAPEFLYNGAGTQIRERGELLTSPRLQPTDATIAGPNPAVLSSQSILRDGDTFTVVSGANRVVFEFDTGPEVRQNIDIGAGRSIKDGNFFQLDDNIFQIDTGGVIELTALPSDHAIVSVQTVVNGQFQSESYEFDRLPNAQGETPSDPAATLIAFQNTTTDALAGRLAAAINTDFGAGTAFAAGSRVSVVGDFSMQVALGSQNLHIRGDAGSTPILQAIDGSLIADGDDFFLQSQESSGNVTQRFEFDSGFTLITPVRYQLLVPPAGGRGISDGERFTITNTATAASITFEFDRDGVTTVTDPLHVISYQPTDSADQIATRIASVIGNAALGLNLAPTNQGGGLVHLGSTIANTLDASAAGSLVQTGQAGGLTDTDRFQISNGLGRTLVFELDSDGAASDPAYIRIPYTQANTHDTIANAIVTAVGTAGLQLSPVNVGNGLINLGGDDGLPQGNPVHALNTTMPGSARNIGQIGRPGVAAGSVAIPYVNSASFTAANVSAAIQGAIIQANNTTQIIQALDGSQYAHNQQLLVDNGGIPISFSFWDERNVGAPFPPNAIPFDPGTPAGVQPVVPPTAAAVMQTRIFNAISSVATAVTVSRGSGNSVVIQQYPINYTTQLVDDRLVVNGHNVVFSPGTSRISDLTNSNFGFTVIGSVEEVYDAFAPQPFVPAAPAGRNLTDHYIATRVADVVGQHVDYQSSGAGGAFSRINFPDAQEADFRGVPVWIPIATSGFGVSAGNERIPLLADDQAANHLVDRDLDGIADDRNGNTIVGETGLPPVGDQVAGLSTKIAAGINAAFTDPLNPNDPDRVRAVASGSFVRLNKGEVIVTPGVQITAQGSGPGGKITGLTQIGDTLYAVSDEGGLYRVNNPFGSTATTTYIETSVDDLLGIDFSGLTSGPPTVEGGRYSDTLFAVDTAGRLYAFDTAGVLQPVFVDGQKSVSTGNHSAPVHGLAFSTLDTNLFGVTPFNPDPNPGVRQAPDEMDYRLGLFTPPYGPPTSDDIYVYYRQKDDGHERYNQTGGTQAIHFGQGFAYDLNGNPLGARTYDFPGGAHGSIVSNEFSLNSYSAADKPALYFSYWLQTENDSSAAPDRMMRDAVRVYVSDNNGDWQLLGTNNSHTENGIVNDELRDFNANFRGATAPDDKVQYFEVQELFDASDWRQMRVALDQYAGRANLRLRIDFSTAGDLNLGDPATTGFEIRTVAGVFIQDGDTVQIDNRTIEFDSGLTLVAPTGAAIPAGEQMTVTDRLGNTAVFQFANNVLTLSDIVAVPGSLLNDGDLFAIGDGSTTAIFEFDTGTLIQAPATGGAAIADEARFVVDPDGTGPLLPATFEFDKTGAGIDIDGIPGADNTLINIRDNLTIVVPANGAAGIGPQDRFSLRRGAQTLTFEFDTDGRLTSPFNVPINIRNNFTLRLPAAGGGFGGVADGDRFTIDPDGTGLLPTVTFEFDDDGTATADEVVAFDHFTTQDVLADRVVAAIANRAATLGLIPKNLGGGLVALDGTTPGHQVSVASAPTVVLGVLAPTQEEVVERVIQAMDGADGTDGSVLGLTLADPADVVNGRIVLGGTTADHVLDTSGSFGLGRTTTPRTPDEIADRMATAINVELVSTTLRAASLEGGYVTLVDLAGGLAHTVDVADAPTLTILGVPGVTPGAISVPFLPTDTVDQIIHGAPAVMPGAPARPGMIQVINSSGLNVVASQSSFPNEDVIVLNGTVGNAVTFSPGVTALRPEGVVPIYVDATQTANDVAERIALALTQAVARGELAGIVPHLNADAGYSPASINTGAIRTNRINLEGVATIVLSSGAASPVAVEGAVGLNDPLGAADRLLVPYHTDMSREQVADELKAVLETLFHNPTIITTTGQAFLDGDTFVLEDGVNAPVVFEFDSGYILQMPLGGGQVAAGGIADGESFTLSDSTGSLVARFEFDKDGSVLPGSTAIPIRENESPLGVSRRVIQAVQSHPLRAALGLNPRLLSDNRVQLGGLAGTELSLSPGSAVLESTPLVIGVPAAGGLAIPDGATFRFTDGITTATFEFDKNGLSTFHRIPITNQSSQAAVQDAILLALATHPQRYLLNLSPLRLNSGIAVQTAAGVSVIDNSPLTFSAPLNPPRPGVSPSITMQIPQTLEMQLPEPLTIHIPAGGFVDGETFTISDGVTTVTFEFEDVDFGDLVDPANVMVRFSQASTAEEIGREILEAIAQSGLNVQPTMLGGTGNLDLGGGSNFVLTLPAGSPLLRTGPLSLQPPVGGGSAINDGDTFFIDDGPTRFTFEFENAAAPNGPSVPGSLLISYFPTDSQSQLAGRILQRLLSTLGLDLNPVIMTGPAQIHLGAGTNLALDTTLTHLTQTGATGQLPDGAVFVVSNGTRTVRFEFDYNGTFNPTNAILDVSPSSTLHQLASEISREVSQAFPGELSPTYEGDGAIHFGGAANIQLDTSGIASITQSGSGGVISDGMTFLVNEGAASVRFEYDKDGAWDPGNVPIFVSDADSTDVLAAKTVAAMSSGSSGLNIFPSYLGDGVIDLGGNEIHGIILSSSLIQVGPLRVQVPAAGGGITGVVDGETFTVTELATATDYVFEFDNNGVLDAGTIAIPFTLSSSQNDVSQALVAAVRNVAGLGFNPVYLGNGVVDLGGDPAAHQLVFNPTVLTTAGLAGAQTPHRPVAFSPSEDFTGGDVAGAITAAVNGTLALNIRATTGAAGTAAQRRVTLTHTTGFPADIQFTPDADGDLQLEAPVDIVKQDQDLIRIIGHNVIDAGPLGFEDLHPDDPFTIDPNTHLPGDSFSGFNRGGDETLNFPGRGQLNQFEGLYLDDFIIGFSERGEEVSNADVNATAFTTNPDGTGRTVGEYQLEIRRGPRVDSPLRSLNTNQNGTRRSMDTNDRQASGVTLVVQRGLDIADGQTFTVGDGVNRVVFEYLDTTIPGNQPEAGRIAVFFAPSDPAHVVAQRVRDAINGPDAQAVLDVNASIADGTLQGVGSPTLSTNSRVVLSGPVTLEVHAVDVEETNDTLAQASDTGIVGVNSPSYLGSGAIGDNPNFPLNPGFDVDLFRVGLAAGERLRVDVDADEIGSSLDAQLRIFDAAGNALAFSDDAPAPGELSRLDPYLEFTPVRSGVFYIGVSGFNNRRYDPLTEGSGAAGSTGFYQIEITFGASTGSDFVLYDERGDSNLFRDQGQILIQGNTITHSAQYAVVSAPAPRSGPAGDIPHMGPVRKTPKLNAENLATGVVIANNVMAFNRTGGVLFSGDANPAGEQTAATPFGRIVNNTIYGEVSETAPPLGTGITVRNYASPTLLNNILAGLDSGISVDATSQTTVTGGMVYQNNTTNATGILSEDFPIFLNPEDPLFRDAAAGNFYLASLSRAIDSSVGSLLERFDLKQVKNLIGIADSPILAPETDVTGQLRVDDPEVETPAGFGENVFIDRGAVDRSDFVGPTASAVNPRDNDADGLDRDSSPTVVVLDGSNVLSSFRIRLQDGIPPADPNLGSGIDDATVISSNVTITRDGVPLVDGIDYSFSYNATSDTVILTPLSGIWEPNRAYVIRLNNADHFLIDAKHGGELPDGATFVVQDRNGGEASFEFESGYTLGIPLTLTLTVPQAGGSLGGVADGSTFTVRRTIPGAASRTATFEFDSNGRFTDNNLDGIPDNFLIPFTVASSAEAIANAMVTQLIFADIALSPRHIGDGVVHMGSTQEHTLDVSRAPALTLTGQPGGVQDGDVFTVDDGTQVLTFEFDRDGKQLDSNQDGVPDYPGAVVITFAPSQTSVEIAEAVAEAVRIADLGLTPAAIGDGRVHLGGTAFVHFVDVTDSHLVLEGEPGVRPAFGIRVPVTAGQPRLMNDGSGMPYLSDGDTFRIGDGVRNVTFELDILDRPGGGFTTAPNIVVAFRGASSADEIANAIVAAIQNAPLQGLNPTNAGNGVVLLGEPTDGTSAHSLNVSLTGLYQLGSAGVPAAVPVNVKPLVSFDSTQVAVAIVRAINGSELDVTAIPDGGDRVIVQNAVTVAEIEPVFDDNSQRLGIKDRAGNLLKPNLLSGETQLTIVLGDTAMDFGDAPEDTGGRYPTQLGQNGPVHMITGSGPLLGSRVDSERDGQVSSDVEGDDIDSNNWIVNTSGTANMSQTSGLTPTVLQLPLPLGLQLSGGAMLADSAQFRVTSGVATVTFEYDRDGTLGDARNVRIPFTADESAETVGVRTADAVNGRSELGLRASSLGGGRVHLGGDGLNVLGTGLVGIGQPNPIADGETFSIEVPATGGNQLFTFEWSDAGQDDGVNPANIAVVFDRGTTQDGYAQAVIDTMRRVGLGIAATALGDGQLELDGDDEDGVLMGAFNRSTVTQVVVTASARGLLDAWIDFNRDGDFDDAGEQIFASQQLEAGENVFEVQPPEDTVNGGTVGRFRISSTGGLRPTGLAPDGEVEDHPVVILAGNPPTTVADAYTFPEDGVSFGSSVLANDFDLDPGDTALLTVASFQARTALGATVVMDVSSNPVTKGTFTYDASLAAAIQALDVGQTIQDTFTYRAKDDMFLSKATTVTITVQGANDAPVAVDDTQPITNQNTALNINVLANDFDPEKHPLTITGVNGGIGDVSIDAVNNVIRYNPAGRFNVLNTGQTATDVFTYQISDGNGGVAGATVTVTIVGLNDPPVAVTDVAPTALTDEKTPANINVLANDFDPEGTALTVTGVQTVGTKGAVTVNNPGTPGNSVRYNPNGKFDSLAVGQTATDVFLYQVRDADGLASLGTVTMTIVGVNNAPVAVNDLATVPRNGTVTINVVANDVDVDGDRLTPIALDLSGAQGTAAIEADGRVTYDPNGQFDFLGLGQTARDYFRYTVSDGNGGTSVATVTVTVFGASDPPNAVDDNVTTSEKESITINALSNDTDDFGPMIIVSVNTNGLQGSVAITPPNQANNRLVYSPDGQFDALRAGERAVEKFTYTVSDGTGSDTATVTVTVTGVNDAPIANIDANGYRVDRGRLMRANDATGTLTPGVPGDDGVLLNDTDAEGDALTAVLVTSPQHAVPGTFRLNQDGTFEYRHNGNSARSDSFAYQARDEHGALSQQIVTVVITIADAPPAEWQNPVNRLDVNNSGAVSPTDVLLTINLINDQGVGYVFPTPRPAGAPYYDVDGDGAATPQDPLLIINYINAVNSGILSGEGEYFVQAEGESAVTVELVGLHEAWTGSRAPLTAASSTTGWNTPLAASPQADDLPRVAPSATAPAEGTVRVDLFGVEDAVDSIAEEVLLSQADRSTLDEILEEWFG